MIVLQATGKIKKGELMVRKIISIILILLLLVGIFFAYRIFGGRSAKESDIRAEFVPIVEDDFKISIRPDAGEMIAVEATDSKEGERSKQGFMNSKGNIVTDIIYNYGYLKNGFGLVSQGQGENSRAIYLDTEEREIFKDSLKKIKDQGYSLTNVGADFKDGYATVILIPKDPKARLYETGQGMQAVISDDGEISIIEPQEDMLIMTYPMGKGVHIRFIADYDKHEGALLQMDTLTGMERGFLKKRAGLQFFIPIMIN